MNHLSEIIINLSKEEIRNFKIFSNRINYGKSNKTVKLFDFLKTGTYSEDDEILVKLLYPKGNKNSFYRLKNRLLDDLKKTLLLQHIDFDEKVSVLNLISLANIFSYKIQYRQALYYLQKAETKAIKNEYYDLVDLIYEEIISIASHYDRVNPLPYIKKQKQNIEKRSVIKQANQAIATINYQLKRINFSKKGKKLLVDLQKVLDDLTISRNVYRLPKIQLKINECVRNYLLQRNDFDVLEQYLINSLKGFKKRKIFSKTFHHDKIVIITWIINSLIKNKKFNKALYFTNILHKELLAYNKLYYEKYIWTYYQSLMAGYFFSGQLQKAIDTMETVKENPKYQGNIFYDLGIYLNLASLYYCRSDVSNAIKNLSKVLTKKLFNSLSVDIKFNISVLEIILHYEKGDVEFTYEKLINLSRSFRSILRKEDYAVESKFINIFKQLLVKVDSFKDNAILSKMKKYVAMLPEIEPGSNEVISYHAWLVSKIYKENYYSTILKMANK